MDDERMLLLSLSQIEGLGNKAKKALLFHFGSAIRVFSCTEREVKGLLFLSDREKDALISGLKEPVPKNIIESLKSYEISFVTVKDSEYPALLLDVYNPPFIIFYRGTLPKANEECVAMVGARRCSAYGKKASLALSSLLAKNGISVVSGLALGIDGFSHEGALSQGGRTYAFLGCGVDLCYPASHEDLFERITKNGAVMSEFPPGTKPLKNNFPVRNRLISGLSKRVVIVEAAEKSGSLITEDFALEQGREVYVFPGRYDDPLSRGTNKLIYQGAGVILSPEEFVSDLLSIKDTALSFTGGTVKGKTRNLEDDEAIVYSCLDFYPKGFERLSTETGLPLLSLISAVMRLCDRGLVMETFKNEYVKV